MKATRLYSPTAPQSRLASRAGSSRWRPLFLLAGILPALTLFAEDKKSDPPSPPKPELLLALPLGVSAGATSHLVLRGKNLDQCTQVRCAIPDAKIKLLKAGKADVPDKVDGKKVGDQQVEIELALPPETPAGELELTAQTPAGEASLKILVVAHSSLIQEKEPNNGFREPQPLTNGHSVLGSIQSAKDVDVYRLDVAAGSPIECELVADQRGSPLDGLLTLYDGRGTIVAQSDDQSLTADPRIEFTPSTAGPYFIAVMDAHDSGSLLHAYRLTVRSKSK